MAMRSTQPLKEMSIRNLPGHSLAMAPFIRCAIPAFSRHVKIHLTLLLHVTCLMVIEVLDKP
jgi:hypothetical protein